MIKARVKRRRGEAPASLYVDGFTPHMWGAVARDGNVMVRLGLLLAAALPLLAACATLPPGMTASAGPDQDQPGWTGRTQVVGNNSTVASNAEATYIQQKWGVGRRN